MERLLCRLAAVMIALVMAAAYVPTIEVRADGTVDCTQMTISAGYAHSLVVLADGSLWAWGRNLSGQLGDGTTTCRHSPVRVLDGVVSIAAGGAHNLAIREDGSLWAWGNNSRGQLGDGTTTNRYSPIRIMEDVVSISVGTGYSLAIREDGSLWAWGINNRGQLGDGTRTDRYSPVRIMDGVVSISAGVQHSLAIREDGSLWAWGSNSYGQLGDSDTPVELQIGGMNFSMSPVRIMDGVVSITAGPFHSLAIKKDGSLWVWGNNNFGQLGDGTTTARYIPIRIIDGVVSISANNFNSLVIREDGSLWAWGTNTNGLLLGDGITGALRPVSIMDGVASISTRHAHILAIREDGNLWAWGWNGAGQLGDGTTTDRYTPVRILDNVMIPCDSIQVQRPAAEPGTGLLPPVQPLVGTWKLYMIFSPNIRLIGFDDVWDWRWTFHPDGTLSIDTGEYEPFQGIWYNPEPGILYTSRHALTGGEDEYTVSGDVFTIRPGTNSPLVFRRVDDNDDWLITVIPPTAVTRPGITPRPIPGTHSEWARTELEIAHGIGLIPSPLLSPDIDLREPITREEYAAVLVYLYQNLANTVALPAIVNPFTDTRNPYVLRALNADIMIGVSPTLFDPHSFLTREMAATGLTRTFKRTTIPGWTYATDADFPLNFEWGPPFADDHEISGWARESVYFMAAHNIIGPGPNNMINPRATTPAQEAIGFATATREQALVISLRMIENFGN